ncbi:pyridoxamine 5'-phosphate oxidase-domain-containing protein [Irpex rosettiformis]|uniref:Pyridoxamine 5'-phosphate oxidase-domain-containing protein n=1 Tax=Irpex rosettiformis TaxID=378272 RepID=A0ACB8ULE1_9APHY|nr:pyridoxamine 5'-phosphate oxidase-domain-containing protein [Irpex rosettiformis]
MRPRWISKVVEALDLPKNKGKIVYQVATVDSHNIPHVRSHVHRGFIIPKSAPNLPLLVTSSDVRAPKVTQMLSNSSVEVCWWMEGSMDQFRISGKATVIPSPDNALKDVLSGVSRAAIALDEGGEIDREDGTDGRTLNKYDWEKKRKEVFQAMSPGLKASWCAPKTPGSRMASYDEANEWRTELGNLDELKTDEERRDYEIALSNFAMIIIEPTEVDWTQLGEQPNRRTLFTRKDEANGSFWVEDILVP